MQLQQPDARPAVVVTGGAGGLGAHLADELIRRGHRVILVDRDRDALTAAAAHHRSAGASVHTVTADLSSLEEARAATTAILRHAPIGALVNNAGGRLPGEQYPDAAASTWLAGITLNLLTPMLMTQLLWQELAGNGGTVVNIGSSGGLGEAPYGSPEYGAAKAGLHRFTASLGDRTDVTVTGVVPGWIGLDRAHRERAALPPDEQAATAPLVEPAAIAEAVADLLEHGTGGEIRRLL
jgi:NAD(P)-dependent dehydrogenase (short-subunit alcohol dehydrogenase family)